MMGFGKQIDILSKSMDNVESTALGDTYFSIFRGSGLEFKGHREYAPGDDARKIDWKASLRSDKLLVKEFFQEKGMDVVFVYDISDTMLFGSHKKVKAHYGAEFILALAGTIIESNYNVGLVCFSDKIKFSFLPASGKNQLGLFFDILSNHSTYGGEYNLDNALKFVDTTYHPGSVVILVSDFLNMDVPIKYLERRFKQMSKKYDFITVVLRDPRDEFMPNENCDIVISDSYGRGSVFLNTGKIKKQYEEYNKYQKEILRKFLKDVNSDYFELYTDKSFIDPTIAFFKRRDALLK